LISASKATSSGQAAIRATSYRKLNRAKFEVLMQLEADLPVPPFTRERDICRSEKRKSLSQIETLIPGCFALLYVVMLGATFVK
jgi:hypothetical protein